MFVCLRTEMPKRHSRRINLRSWRIYTPWSWMSQLRRLSRTWSRILILTWIMFQQMMNMESKAPLNLPLLQQPHQKRVLSLNLHPTVRAVWWLVHLQVHPNSRSYRPHRPISTTSNRMGVWCILSRCNHSRWSLSNRTHRWCTTSSSRTPCILVPCTIQMDRW